MADQPNTTDEPLGSQARLDALYSATWQQWAREHDAKMEIETLSKQVAELRAELETSAWRPVESAPLDDARGIDALLAELDSKVREPGSYSSAAATDFARRWRERADGK